MNTKNTPSNKMTGFRMTGGIDIDLEEMKKLPDANYWKMGASWAKSELWNMFDRIGKTKSQQKLIDMRVNDILSKYYNESKTWMEICIKAEHMLDLCKALVNKEK